MTTRGSDVLVSSALGGAPSTFRLDHVIDQSSGQESMFDVVRPQLDDALAGFNTTVFAYGQTGTGKTHTMLGVDMWQLAQTDASSLVPSSSDRATPSTGIADAVSAGALQPGTPGYDDVVGRLMDYDGDYHPDWGLIPRAMAYLFRKLQVGGGVGVAASPRGSPAGGAYSASSSSGQHRRSFAGGNASGGPFGGRLPDGIKVTVSYLEIYNEKVFDLLNPEVAAAATVAPAAVAGIPSKVSRGVPGLDIVSDPLRGVCVPDAVAVPVTNEAEVLALLWEGARNRVLASTDMNEHSSRSHTIWQVGIERRHRRPAPDSPLRRPSTGGAAAGAAGRDPDDADSAGLLLSSALGDAETVVSRSKVSLVDLAGSEKIKSHALDTFTDRRLTELTSINQSLSCLGNCVRALASRSRTHIPFRDSKLTRLLQDSLGGNCKTLFVVTLSLAGRHVEESLSTLHFADRAKRVEVHAEKNETLDDASLARRFKAEAVKLRKQLARVRAGAARSTEAMAAAAAAPGISAEEAAALRQRTAAAEEEAGRWRAAAARAEEEALAARAARRRVIVAAAAAARDAAGGEGGDDRALRAAVAAADTAKSAADARQRRLAGAEEELQKQRIALERHSAWLQSLPLVIAPRAGMDALSTAPSQTKLQMPSSRLALLEGQVQRLSGEVRAARNAFLADLQRLRDAAAAAEGEADLASHEASKLRGRVAELEAAVGPHGRSSSPRGAGQTRAEPGQGGTSSVEAEALLAEKRARDAARQRWTRHVDRRTQRSYWHDEEAGSTQWERPRGWETTDDLSARTEAASVVSAFREQQARLLKAVTHQLTLQVTGIADSEGGASAARLRPALSAEVERYAEETGAALQREADMLAASLGLR